MVHVVANYVTPSASASCLCQMRSLVPHARSLFLHSKRHPTANGRYAERWLVSMSARARDDPAEEQEEEAEVPGGAEVETGGAEWADVALEVAREVLTLDAASSSLALYSFRAIPQQMRADVRLDKLSDPRGSPSLDDIEDFSRRFYKALEERLGEEVAGRMEVEVSSPGAERPVGIPGELERFRDLPMRVDFERDDGARDSHVVRVVEWDAQAGTSVWALADVRANRAKGRPGLTRKQREERFAIPFDRIVQARLHVDF